MINLLNGNVSFSIFMLTSCVCIIVLTSVLGTAYAFYSQKPVYTAEGAVIFNVSIQNVSETAAASFAKNTDMDISVLNSYENLFPICAHCNTSKAPDYYKERVRDYDDYEKDKDDFEISL